MLREGPASAAPWQRYGNWSKKDYGAFNTLRNRAATAQAPKDGELRPLPAVVGDPEKGKTLAFTRQGRGGGCMACHVLGSDTPELPGNVGPDLSEIGLVGHDDAYLFNYVYDARVYNPETVMPPWGKHGLYNEEEIMHIVAFLKTLKGAAKFKNDLDNPTERPEPVEDRDWRDPFVNPAAEAFETGAEMFKAAGASGKACASCHSAPEKQFKRWAVTMPKYDSSMKKLIGVEEFLYRHAAATVGENWLMQSPENLQMAIYMRSLANGEAFAVDTTGPGVKEAMALAQTLFTTKIGQMNFACADCHTVEKGAKKWIRGQFLGESRNQLPHFPTWRTSLNQIWDIRKRLQWCNLQVRANELPPDAPEYDALDLFLTAASNGLPMESPGIRH